MESVGPPRTADGNAFRFRANRPSLDLCSTVLWRYVSPVEQLHEPDDLARWFVEAGLWADEHPVTEADVQAARALRENLYDLFLAHLHRRELPKATVINRRAARPDPAPQLDPIGQVHWLTGEPVPAALSAIARDGIDLIAGPLSGRLRECAAPKCAFLFVDTSRSGTRRWCAHNRCGNRQHVREYRARQHSVRRS